jgi:hypothetical protein
MPTIPPNGGWQRVRQCPQSAEVLQERTGEMLEWKARILTLMIAFLPFWDRLGKVFDNNWNW